MRSYDTMNRLLFVVIVLLVILVAISLLYTFLTFGILGLIGAAVVTPGAMFVVLKAFRGQTVVVEEGTVKVVERLGAFNRVLYPGSAFLIDPFDHVRTTVDTTEQQHEFTAEKVLIGSSARPTLRVLIRYRIMRRPENGEEIADEQAVRRAVYEVKDWKEATRRQAEATLRDMLGETGWRDEFIGVSPTGDTIIPRPRTYINSRLRFHLDRETRRWGVNVTRCSVQVVDVDQANLDSAFAIRAARRRAELARIQAQSEKEIQIRKFEAELAKIKMQAEAIRQGLRTPDFVALKWIEAIERLASDSQSKWVIPVEFLETVRQITTMMHQQQVASGGFPALGPGQMPPEPEPPEGPEEPGEPEESEEPGEETEEGEAPTDET